MPRIPTGAALLACLGACTAVTSVPLDAPDEARVPATGLVYFMPTTEIPLSIAVTRSGASLTAGDPVYLPDERHGFRLSHVFSPAHASTIVFEAPNGLLSAVKVTSDGRLDEAAVAAARSLAIAELAQQSPTAVFSEGIRVDAHDARTAEGAAALAALNARIRGNIRAVSPTDAESFSIDIRRSQPPAGLPGIDPDRCRVGFCYRLPVGYTIRVTYRGVTHARTVSVPNGSPIYPAALDRGLFTEWVEDIALENGMLKTRTREIRGSELEAVAALPAALVTAYLEALTDLSTDRRELLEAQLELDRTRAEIDQLRAATPEAVRTDDGTLFQVHFGDAALPDRARADMQRPRIGLAPATPPAADPVAPEPPDRPQTPGSDGTG